MKVRNVLLRAACRLPRGKHEGVMTVVANIVDANRACRGCNYAVSAQKQKGVCPC